MIEIPGIASMPCDGGNPVSIPVLVDGYLPTGLHDCNLPEIVKAFGGNSHRKALISGLDGYIDQLKMSNVQGWIIVNGSFVTSKGVPKDIDVIIVIDENRSDYSFSGPASSLDYTLFDRYYAKDNYGLHVFVVPADPSSRHGVSDACRYWIDFFSSVRDNPRARKGLLRVAI